MSIRPPYKPPLGFNWIRVAIIHRIGTEPPVYKQVGFEWVLERIVREKEAKRCP